MSAKAAELLDGWVPVRVYYGGGRALVDWCHLGALRFTEPFFDQTVDAAMRRPFNLVFRHQTPVETLLELEAARPGLAPNGFVFHMSRCGSTLVAQTLAALPRAVVLSEASPVDAVIRARGVGEDVRAAWLRALLSALGQRRAGTEDLFFVKFDSWHTSDLALVRRAFPRVPWAFLYREPEEVVVSQLRRRGAQTIPYALDPASVGLDLDAALKTPPEEYCARVLGRICESALAHHDPRACALVNYRELPGAVWTRLAEHFRLSFTPADLELMRAASRRDAKNPALNFAPDSDSKRGAASPEVRRAADQWVRPLYDELEARRLSTRQK